MNRPNSNKGSNIPNMPKNNNNPNKAVLKKKVPIKTLDSIISNSNNIYGNYKAFVNDFIKSKLDALNNSKFNNVKSNNNNNQNNNSKNNNNNQSNENEPLNSITINKMKYINTYVIPLIYLINSYQYQKYLNNLELINNNILIINDLNFNKKFNFDYNLPIIKNVNIKIYQNYFGGLNNNKKSKNKKHTNNNIVNNIEQENKVDAQIDQGKLNNLASQLDSLSSIIKNLSEPFDILFKIQKIENDYLIITLNNDDEKIKQFEKLTKILDEDTNLDYQMKRLYKKYFKNDFNIKETSSVLNRKLSAPSSVNYSKKSSPIKIVKKNISASANPISFLDELKQKQKQKTDITSEEINKKIQEKKEKNIEERAKKPNKLNPIGSMLHNLKKSNKFINAKKKANKELISTGGARNNKIKKKYEEDKIIKEFYSIINNKKLQKILDKNDIEDFLNDRYYPEYEKQKKIKENESKKKEEYEIKAKINKEQQNKIEKTNQTRQKILNAIRNNKIFGNNIKKDNLYKYDQVENITKWRKNNKKDLWTRDEYSNSEKKILEQRKKNKEQLNKYESNKKDESKKKIEKLENLKKKSFDFNGNQDRIKIMINILNEFDNNFTVPNNLSKITNNQQSKFSNQIINIFYKKIVINKEISDYIKQKINNEISKLYSEEKKKNIINIEFLSIFNIFFKIENYKEFIDNLITIEKSNDKDIIKKTLTDEKLKKYFLPDDAQKGGSKNSVNFLSSFYIKNLLENNSIILKSIKNIFDDIPNNNSYTREFKLKKYDFEDEFKILKDDLNTNKNIFDLKSTLELYINNIDETINNYKENLNELNLEQKKYSEKIKKKNNIERDINKIKINETKSKRNLDSSENILRSNLSLTGSDPITDAKLRSKLREINKDYERRSVQNNYSDWSRKKKAYQQIINSLNEKKLLMNSIENNEKELKSINKEIKNIQKKIEELDKEKKKLILQKEKTNKIFTIDNIKSDFINYYNKIIQISRDINELIQDIQKNNKQDIYNFYFKKDEKLNNLINKLAEAFGVNYIINKTNININININITKNNNSSNIPDNQTVYNILKGENKKFEKISDILKSYTKKMKNNNLNKINIKNNTKKKLENIINPKPSSESQINNQSNSSGGGELDLIDHMSEYIDKLESKNIDINNELFFLRIMKDLDNYTLDDETKMYFEYIKENHLNIINKLKDKIDNLDINRTDKLKNNSLKKKFNKELNYTKTELKKIDEKYSKLNSKKYKSNKTIYVFTYTDNLKLYFIILNLLELYISNY